MRRNERKLAPHVAPDERPLAIVEQVSGALRLAAVDARAAANGCAVGNGLSQARAVCPSLRVVLADPHEDARLLEAVADWCDRYTPLVALDGFRGLLLDVSGCARLFGGEAALLRDMIEALASRGLLARGAVAGAAGPARALAWFTQGGVMPEGSETSFVRALPIAALGMDEATRTALGRAGLKTLGAAAGRGRDELAARFGRGLVEALDRTLGISDPPISPRRPAPSFVVERRFAEPILAVEAALAALRDLAEALSRRLETVGRGLQSAEAALFRANGAVERVRIGTGEPTRDPDLLMRLLRERFDALSDPLDPGFGYEMARLSAFEDAALGPSARAFDRREEDERALAELIDRLAAREGRARVLRFAPQDAHRPEAEARLEPAQGFAENGRTWPEPLPGEPPRRPLRLFSTPEPIEVVAEVPDGPPARFVWRRIAHEVARSEGPERIALEWWRGAAGRYTRDYFRVEVTSGARFWLYRDGLFGRESLHPRWYLHGLFA